MGTTVAMALAAAALLTLAAYAHFRLPFFTARKINATATRVVLTVVGMTLGWVLAARYRGDPALQVLAFAIGFGAVHLPAAVILFVKYQRGEPKS